MADIAPFKGLLYNRKLVPNLDAVITPPYDVISPEEQGMYHQRHPYNMIRLILGPQDPENTPHNSWYQSAAETFQTWQREGVLIRDPKPAIYDYEIDYREPSTQPKTRLGFICLVRLQDFSLGSVRPHERTYEETKSDRLKLMCACNANLSQVFALYSDPAHLVSHHLQQGREGTEVFDFVDRTGIRHRMWRVNREDALQRIVASMKDKTLYIADGHHRYETALNYQHLMQQKYPQRGSRASFNYVLMYLSNMHQSGLSILPTHRMFVHLHQFNMTSFLARTAEYFEVARFPFNATTRNQVLEEFLHALRSAGDRNFIGVYAARSDQFVLLKLRLDVDHEFWRGDLPQSLQELDVVVLTDFILKRLLKVDELMLNDETRITYRHDSREAIEQVDHGLFQVAFLLNHTRVEQVEAVASSGLIMPHKSTYFYPKVIDGSVLNLLEPEENVSD
ncbi:MAG: DUF1015 domain-containing protein [Deltaproteobacteria bacterium]|nr:MAG: DUF1015 domain-containing protein [Deltaproteobacteria bacterium]